MSEQLVNFSNPFGYIKNDVVLVCRRDFFYKISDIQSVEFSERPFRYYVEISILLSLICFFENLFSFTIPFVFDFLILVLLFIFLIYYCLSRYYICKIIVKDQVVRKFKIKLKSYNDAKQFCIKLNFLLENRG